MDEARELDVRDPLLVSREGGQTRMLRCFMTAARNLGTSFKSLVRWYRLVVLVALVVLVVLGRMDPLESHVDHLRTVQLCGDGPKPEDQSVAE